MLSISEHELVENISEPGTDSWMNERFKDFWQRWKNGERSVIILGQAADFLIHWSYFVFFPLFRDFSNVQNIIKEKKNDKVYCRYTLYTVCRYTVNDYWLYFHSFPFLEQIYPCDLKPCKNGATCTNDPDDISLHHCQCPTWFTGQNCEGLRIFFIRQAF